LLRIGKEGLLLSGEPEDANEFKVGGRRDRRRNNIFFLTPLAGGAKEVLVGDHRGQAFTLVKGWKMKNGFFSAACLV
jgi:hypothetical protein